MLTKLCLRVAEYPQDHKQFRNSQFPDPNGTIGVSLERLCMLEHLLCLEEMIEQ